MKGIEFDQAVNGAGGDAEALADDPIRDALGAEPQNLLPEFCRAFRPADLRATGAGGDQLCRA